MNITEQIKRWKDVKRENYNCISLNHFLTNSISNVFMIENIFFPILIGKNLIQFTNVVLISKSSGDNYYLILINGKYHFFNTGYESDCDGGYYYGHTVTFLEVIRYIEDFEVAECYTKDLLKELSRI